MKISILQPPVIRKNQRTHGEGDSSPRREVLGKSGGLSAGGTSSSSRRCPDARPTENRQDASNCSPQRREAAREHRAAGIAASQTTPRLGKTSISLSEVASATAITYTAAAKDAQVAQLVEQRTENPRVAGSIPALGTINQQIDSSSYTDFSFAYFAENFVLGTILGAVENGQC